MGMLSLKFPPSSAISIAIAAHTPLTLLTLAAPFIWLDTDQKAFKHGESLGV